MDSLTMVTLAFMIVATCGKNPEYRGVAWVLTLFGATIIITTRIMCAVLGIEVD